ncbi:rhodanese-like domain-containing protein [Methylocapsa aurea]|uniref:rhodanese-like domain-containing protein n=1 Tax=Methylocapsa aurea TaxID=663610 RepID=UPI00068B7C02|nr:rhodanese-like domain-containing protein [Methylocapsa aurea]
MAAARRLSMGLAGVLQCLPLCVFAALALAQAPEPQGFWTGAMQGETPPTLSGGEVIHTEALAEITARGGIILVDVDSSPRRPANLAATAIWKPLAHRNIKGSVWIPGAGAGDLDDAMNGFFRDRLMALTGGDLERPIAFYCHPRCWGSWNAAKRAIGFGYRNVYWYPDGVEGWQEAGHPLVAAQPEGPDQAER